jgi:Flp pilus assembly protein TadG
MAVFRALKSVFRMRVQDPSAAETAPKRGFLTHLARNEAGNTLAMMAIALFPLAGLVGGGFDMSRMYLVKTRLQQACDAGALAGRRIMGAGQWSANSNAANTAAEQFFDGNFENNAYGTINRTRSFAEAAGRVTGTASATVPMTLMRIFGQESRTITVECDAEMRLPNTDIMFVLDTTGSMAETIPGDTSQKIVTLKFAVKCFYETVARLNTAADCTPGTPGPTSGTAGQTQIRFGFMPYATNVNVGRLLDNAWLADSWQYQTRTANTTTVYAWSLGTASGVSWGSYNSPTVPTPTSFSNVSPASATVDGYPAIRTGVTSTTCATQTAPATTDVPGTPTQTLTGTTNNPPTYPATEQTLSYSGTEPHTVSRYRYNWNSSSPNGGTNRCHLQVASATYNKTRTGSATRPIAWTPYQRFVNWTYQPASLDISGLKAGGTTWNASIQVPQTTSTVSNVRLSGSSSTTSFSIVANRTVSWPGCIEERATVRETDYSPIPDGAFDLDIDLVPDGTATSLWGPALPGAVYARTSGGDPTLSSVTTTSDFYRADSAGLAACGTEARKLQTWGTASAFETYVDSLATTANTYHDIGLIWGARFMSPDGIFASENATTPQGGEIERHMIFMTDGQTCTSSFNYAAYGLPWYDRRQTPVGTEPTGECDDADSDGGMLSQQVNLRFAAICEEVRNKNITLWVVYFGTTDADTVNRMTACATPGRFFNAANSTALIATFRQIAEQISQLRLTR